MQTKKRPCSWCRGGSSLDIGTGFFADFDSDFSDGIPVCGGCGGLGEVPKLEDERFRTLVKEIMNLRFKFCLVTGADLKAPPPSADIRIRVLKEMIEKITFLWKTYGNPDHRCFARTIAEGGLESRIRELQTLN